MPRRAPIRTNSKLAGFLFVGLAVAGSVLLNGHSAVFGAGEPIKIAVVDLEALVARSAAGKKLQAQLESFKNQAQAEGETMAGKAREIQQQLVEGEKSLPAEKLQELQKQLEDAQIGIRRFRDDKQREGQKMQTEGLRQIEAQLKPVFEKVRDEGGYDLILNNVSGVVILANEKVDITARILEQFDKGN